MGCWIEYRKPVNPGSRGEREDLGFGSAARFQGTLIALPERRASILFARRTPSWIKRCHSTLLALGAQFLWRRLRTLGLDMRCGKQRPRYGFNVDRIGDSIDAITSLVTRPIAFHNGGRTLLR
jgi:hypothetical protein